MFDVLVNVFRTLGNVFKIPELRNKILFTLGMLCVYRIGFWIPVPGVNQTALADFFQAAQDSNNALANVGSFIAMFSGGQLSQSTIFGLGIMPYISASIIIQLLGTAVPSIKKLQEEGATGRQKIQEYTRYLTIALCIFQAVSWLMLMSQWQSQSEPVVYAAMKGQPLWWVMATTSLTAGTVFLMWLGEQIDRYGIGNGASMIITAGILTGMPSAVLTLIQNFDPGGDGIGIPGLLSLACGFVFVVAGAVLMTVAQRRIPIQQAKHTRGRRVYGGQKSYLPLRVNHSGVMPIIFASSLMIFPSIIFNQLGAVTAAATAQNPSSGMAAFWDGLVRWLNDSFNMGAFPYILLFILMTYFFSFFWITVQFSPEDMSKQLKEHGSFIPGLRPGPRTAEYLEAVMERITFVGAAFLAIIAVIPMLVSSALGVPQNVSQFLGGTGLLIVVSVALDVIQRIEANLLMRNYAGFLGGDDAGGKARRIRGPRG